MTRSNSSMFGVGQGGVNIAAALDAVAHSEIGDEILAKSDDGYDVIVGSTPQAIKTFVGYTVHPNMRIFLPKINDWSTAAGRYQILNKYAVVYMRDLRLSDFSPISQDRIALQLMRECGAVSLFVDGKFDAGIVACKSRWASLPGANYGQHENTMESLRAAFMRSGGIPT